MQIAILLALVLPLVPPSSTPPTEDADDRVAPSTDGVVWIDEGEGETHKTATSEGLGSLAESFDAPRKSGLENWRGRPVVLVTFPERSHRDTVPLLELIARANADRQLVVGILLAAPPGTEADSESPRPSDKLALGFVGADQPWSVTQHVLATVIGPSGERIGDAKLPDEEAELFDLLHIAMNRYGAPPLAQDLPEPLFAAQTLYFGGQWDKARAAAAKVAKRAATKAPEVAEAASAFARTIDDFERDLHTKLIDANSAFPDNLTIATVAAAAGRGFPKGRSVELVQSMLEAKKKTMEGAVALEACIAFVEALPGRPVLFTEVADGPAKKHARVLERIAARANSYSGRITKLIQALLLRHEAAPKRR